MNELEINNSDDQYNEMFPQVIHMGPDYDFDGPESLTRITVNEPLTFVPDLKSFTLDPDTNLTDIVSQTYIYTDGLLVSERVHQVLKDCVMASHVNYPATVVHRDRAFQYYWLHFTDSVAPGIDFSRSRFVVIDQDESIDILVTSSAGLQEWCRRVVQTMTQRLTAQTVSFKSGTPRYDLFFLDVAPRIILLSKDLTALLADNGFTGFQLKPSAINVEYE